jgi:hypothetical protein
MVRAQPGRYMRISATRHGQGTARSVCELALGYYVPSTRGNVASNKMERRIWTVRKNLEVCGRSLFKATIRWHGRRKARKTSNRIATNRTAISTEHRSWSVCSLYVTLHAVIGVPWINWERSWTTPNHLREKIKQHRRIMVSMQRTGTETFRIQRKTRPSQMCLAWISQQTAIIFLHSIDNFIGFYYRNGKCLVRGMSWMFKYNSGQFNL